MPGLLGMNELVRVSLRPRAIHNSQHAPSLSRRDGRITQPHGS